MRANPVMLTALAAVLAGAAACGGSGDPGGPTSTLPPSTSAPTTSSTPSVTTGTSTTTETSGTPTTPSTTSSPTPARAKPVLSFTGLAGVPLGAPAPRFAAALGAALVPLDAQDRQLLAERECVSRAVVGYTGLELRVLGDDPDGPVRVVAVGEGSRVTTSAGVGLGAGLADVRRAYAAFLVDERFDFNPVDGRALAARAGGGARWVFIADSSGRLVEMRLGQRPTVYDPEGCA